MSTAKKKGNPYYGVSKKDVGNLLVTAFEGGSNYWYEITEKKLPKKADYFYMSNNKLENPVDIPENKDDYKSFKAKTGYHGIYDTILNGGEITICDSKEKSKKYQTCHQLSLNLIRKKIPQVAKKHPKTWERVKDGQYDASDADVFLQEVLFDEIIYG